MIELLFGLILLVFGGEVLVRNASALAIKSRVPPLIVGLTVVSIGTSSPELFTSLQAVWSDVDGIAVGNVIGSNIKDTIIIIIHGTRNHSHPHKDGLTVINSILLV